jgi:hypothetical protein
MVIFNTKSRRKVDSIKGICHLDTKTQGKESGHSNFGMTKCFSNFDHLISGDLWLP